jgi:heme-degrading monooxygenase HmoA
MFLVIFRNRKRPDLDAAAYAVDAEAMSARAATMTGYLAFKSYTAADGEVVAISEWADEAAARAWARDAEHAAIQRKGREDYYAEYTLFTAENPRTQHFKSAE